MIKAPQIHRKTVSEVVNVAVDCRGLLDDNEVVTGTPALTEDTTADLTIGSATVSTATLNINGADVPIGQAVTFQVSAGLANVRYSITLAIATDASQLRRVKIRLNVRPD